jgi:hypothetical protein
MVRRVRWHGTYVDRDSIVLEEVISELLLVHVMSCWWM